MFQIFNKHLILVVYAVLSILLTGISSTTYADTLARYVMAANGDRVVVGDNTLDYTIGQPFMSTDYSSRLTSGFLNNGLRKDNPPDGPVFPMIVQGNLTENGQPMPVGTIITYLVNDSVIGETTTLTAGEFNQNGLSGGNVLINQHSGKLSFKVNGVDVTVEQITPSASNLAACPADADNIIFVSGQICQYDIALVTETEWDGTVEGYKFIDTNNNGEYDTSETLVEGRHYIVMKPTSYSGSPFSAIADNGHYKFYNVKNGTYSMWQHVDAGWLTSNLTTEAEIKWSSDDPVTVSISDDGIRIDGNLLDKIDFPIPDFANPSNNVIPEEVTNQITTECEDVDYVLCGLDSPNDCLSSSSATVIDLTTSGEWPTTGDYGDIGNVFATSKLLIFGKVYLPRYGNNQNITVGSICNYGTLTLAQNSYNHPIVMDFRDWFINYGEVLGVSPTSTQSTTSFAQTANIERIEIRSNAPWGGLSGTFYNEGTLKAGNGKLFDYTSLNVGTRMENKKLVGFPQLNDLLQLNQLAVFKLDNSDNHVCNNAEYVDGTLVDNQSYSYTAMPDGAVLASCYDYTNQGTIADSLEPEDALSTGGDVKIEAANIYQKGNIEAGKGTGINFKNKNDVPYYFNKLRFGGKGGDTTLRSTNMVFTKDSTTRGGNGGNVTVEEGCLSCTNVEVKGGQGGDLTIDPAGNESDISIYGMLEGNSVYVEPDLMLAGKDTNIVARKDVVIFGGDNWKLVLNDLRDDAIVAGRDITVAVGDGGSVDLRGNTSKVFKAGGKVAIYADNVLLDQGVQLEDIIQASEIVRGPNKIIYRVVLNTQDVQGKANETIPVKLEVSNAGPKIDTYTLSATSEKGIAISGLPSSITIEGLTRKQLDLSIALPAEGNDTITITATSQADPTVVATKKIRTIVDLPPVVEPENVLPTAALSITPETGEAPLTIALDGSASTDTDGTIASYKWTASDGQTVEGQNAQLTFNEVGDYTITLEVTDNEGATAQVQKTVTVQAPNELPTAALAITPETGEAPLTVALDGSASSDTDGTIASYAWTASNGQTANGQNAELTFSEAGDYTITLKVTDNDGATNSATKNVKVEAAANYVASGTILDKEGNPIAGVTVQVGDKTALTDAAGNWEITDLAESNYTATASKDGYIFGSKDFAVGNDQNASVSFKAESVLDVKVKSEPGTAQQGENITYTITVTNKGSEIATGVVLTDTLPTDANLVSIEALDGGDCSAETVSCTLSDLTPGATATIKLVISNTKADQLVNTAKVTANDYPADVQITRTTVTPYFSVSLSDTPDPVTMGGTLHYTVEVDLSQFAPKDATGVELVLQLPNGVELENATTDHGSCDSSKLPTVTCTINDLSIASAEAISHITVNLNVTLIDMGLLLLTHDAKVTSTDYPAHSVKERTKIFIGDVKVDMVFVIDTTYSMAAEINGVIVALRNFIEKIDPSKAPLIVLVEFKDDVRFKAATRDLDILLGAVEDLKAEGGGTCPEASAEALTLAVEHLKDGGVILFTTDASPYADADIEKLGKLMSGKDMNLVTILTGDCSNQDDWNVLP